MANFNYSTEIYIVNASDGGGRINIRIWYERAANLNPTATAGPPTLPGFAKASGSGRRKRGLHARGVVVAKQSGTAPAIRIDYAFVPILTETDYGTVTIGQTITTGSLTGYKVVAKVPELIR